MSDWREVPWMAFDLETSGLNWDNDRVVTGAAVLLGAPVPGAPRPVTPFEWLVDPGIPIPEAATAIHGITSEYAHEYGMLAPDAIERITATLAVALGEGTPIVGANLQFDFTLLDRECLRYGLEPLDLRVPGGIRPVIDVYVIDRCNQFDEYRDGVLTLKGGTKYVKGRNRKLDTGLCPYYGVTIEGAHNSTVDALAAAKVAWKMAAWYPQLAAMKLDDLHAMQVAGKADQARFLAAYLRREGKHEEADGVRPEWPFVPEEQTLW